MRRTDNPHPTRRRSRNGAMIGHETGGVHAGSLQPSLPAASPRYATGYGEEMLSAPKARTPGRRLAHRLRQGLPVARKQDALNTGQTTQRNRIMLREGQR